MLVAANAAAVVGLWWRAGRVARGPRRRGAAHEPGPRHRAARSVARARRAAAPGAHPGARRGRASSASAPGTALNGTLCLALIAAHTLLITAGYALTDDVPITREAGDLLTGYSGVLLATIALALLVAVVITSVVTVRRRLSYRVWHAVHVGAYVAIALGFSHQLATGHEFLGQPLARAYWWALYAATLAALVGFRVVLPVARSLRHRLRIERRGARGARRRLAGDRRRRPPPAAGALRVSRCTGASSRAGTGGRPTRSPCPPRRTGGGCASPSRSSATTPPGSPRCRRVRASSSRDRRAG